MAISAGWDFISGISKCFFILPYTAAIVAAVEMSCDVIERLISIAMEAGVSLFVVTGGKPYMRVEMMEMYKKYCRSHQRIIYGESHGA